MSAADSPIKIIRSTEAVRESLAALITTIETADPALLVTATSGNAVTREEFYAEANAAVPTAGSVAANLAAKNTYLAGKAAMVAALNGNALGEGVQGLAIETELARALGAVGDTSLAPGAVAVPGSIQIGLAEFWCMYQCVLQLGRARTILTPCFSVNAK